MKGKLSPIYYIIPVVYIGVILFFIFMQFQAREEFGHRVGSLSISGVYVKTLGGGQRLRHLEVRFHDLRSFLKACSEASEESLKGRMIGCSSMKSNCFCC